MKTYKWNNQTKNLFQPPSIFLPQEKLISLTLSQEKCFTSFVPNSFSISIARIICYSCMGIFWVNFYGIAGPKFQDMTRFLRFDQHWLLLTMICWKWMGGGLTSVFVAISVLVLGLGYLTLIWFCKKRIFLGFPPCGVLP